MKTEITYYVTRDSMGSDVTEAEIRRYADVLGDRLVADGAPFTSATCRVVDCHPHPIEIGLSEELEDQGDECLRQTREIERLTEIATEIAGHLWANEPEAWRA